MQHNILRISTIDIEKFMEIESEFMNDVKRKKLFHKNLDDEEDKIIQNLKKNIEDNNQKIKNYLYNIKNSDAYLIHSVREDVLDKLNEYHKFLYYLKKESNIFKLSNDIVENSIDKVIDSKKSIENFNHELIERRKKEYASFFLKSEINFDDNQKTAIITDDKHNLVVASAGSGKTEVLITRIAYLVFRKQERVEPNRILVLAYQTKAANDIKERLKKRFGIDDVKVKTFHSLGFEILNTAAVKPKLKFNSNNFDFEYTDFITSLYKKEEKDFSFKEKILQYLLSLGNQERLRTESDYETKDEWYNYLKNLSYVALNGTKVKSEGERIILNFFLSHKINGKYIQVRYEYPSYWMNYHDKNGQLKTPKPDFFLPEYDLYIEHWALNENAEVPEWFKNDDPSLEYKRGMQLKIEKFKQHPEYTLLQISYRESKRNDFIEYFKTKLTNEIRRKNPTKDIILSPISYTELVERIWKLGKESIERIPKDIATFITKAKTNGLTPQNINERLEKKTWSPKQKAFSELALVIYKNYEKALNQTDEIDFSDMINQALTILESNQLLYNNSIDHILIDEYQDISSQRYKLIKKLMAKNTNCKLFCVGDDWQSIMGFSGSNLEFFVKFGNYFDNPARTDLSINYRSIKSIVDAGANLIKYNRDAQLAKETRANDIREKKISVYSYFHKNPSTYIQQAAEHCVKKVKQYLQKGYAPQDIYILYREKSPLLKLILDYGYLNDVSIQIDTRSPSSIPLMTVHKSKGLQARTVFILSVNKGLHGIPSEKEDPLIFEPAMETKYKYKEEEERRLFYVALTRAKEDIIIYTQKDNESMFLDEIQNHIDVIDMDFNS
ncbi:ATP-dependent DNA helicase Rep [uncultured archaeon]|nr:ATP-dependent DNA helicase Rep [uncultured archaeon]